MPKRREKSDFKKHGGFYLIGEASRLGGISQRTLRHYDRLKLIEPDFIGENGYRYYLLDTLLKIPVINYLKAIGLSLDEIAAIFSSDDFSEIRQRLKECVDDCDVKQCELDERRKIIVDWAELIDEANHVLNLRPEDVSLRFLPPQEFLSMPYHFWGNYADATINLDFTLFVKKHDNVITGPVILRHASIDECFGPHGQARECDVFVLQKALRPIAESERFNRAEGFFLSTYHVGSFEEMNVGYERLVAYAKEHDYHLCGCSYERFVTDYWTTYNTDLFVVEILLPIEQEDAPVSQRGQAPNKEGMKT